MLLLDQSNNPLMAVQGGYGSSEVHAAHSTLDGPSGFTGKIDVAPGNELTVLPTGPKPCGHYDVLSGDERVGALVLGGRGALARMTCADGDWWLHKRRRLGWDLFIGSRDGEPLGWYSGRKWLPGGTISLVDGTQFELRRSLNRRWRLSASDGGERVLQLRTLGASAAQKVVVVVRLRPAGTADGSLLLLTSCAVVMLDRMMGFFTIGSAQ